MLKQPDTFRSFYAPKAATGSSRLPVLIWLHGGSLVYGSSTAPGLDGSVFASRNNAVVVTLQYRLGFLGFLKADSAGAGGNMAVKDVLLALSA
jgi:carboxylesterase type B